jgi:hypothetical protein
MLAVQPLSSSNPVNYQTALARAWQLVRAFRADPLKISNHYPYISKIAVADGLADTLNNKGRIISQESSSLCGPAAFFYTLLKIRPDIYVQLVIELYSTGKSKLKELKLESSRAARKYKPVNIREVDWIVLSSIKPEYDHPNEQFDGITLPGRLKGWFVKAGFTDVEDHTNLVFNKSLDDLLQAQLDYSSGYKICLFVDADVFFSTNAKVGGSTFPNHWVVMNSDIKIQKFDAKTKTHQAPTIINSSIVKKIKKQIRAEELDQRTNGNGYAYSKPETEDKILLDAFTWGKQYVPVSSRISRTQNARLSYFLNGFHGYLKIKR